MASLSHELGIDLGTLNTRIVEGKDILLQEPTIVAILLDELKLVEIGKSALNMMGRVPENIEVIRPMRFGVIAEYEITENFLREMVRMVTGRMLLFRPKLMITVPFGITSVERRAVYEAGLGAGSRDVYLIQQPLAGAIGIDLPIGAPTGNMIICLGGGTSQAAVLAMHSLVSAETSRVAGLELDEAIISFVRQIWLDHWTALEQLKFKSVLHFLKTTRNPCNQGRISFRFTQTATITTDDIVEALQHRLNIARTIRRVLEKTPELFDIIDRGVALCGGTTL